MNLYRQRVAKLQQAMLREGVDVFLASTQVNMQYLSGYSEPPLERLMFLLTPKQGDPVWLVPALSADGIARNPAGWEARYVWHDSDGPTRALEACTRDYDLETATIAVDDEMPAAFLLALQEALPAALFRRGGELIGCVRAVKDVEELRNMREAARLTDEALAAGLERCVPGYSEWAVAIAIQRALFESGSKLAFGIPIVAAGEMSAMPHHTTSQRPLQRGDVVLIDYGGVYEGYCSDITRVASVGRAPDEAKAIYEIVYEAHMRAREAAKPGVPAREVDAVARRVIEKAGYGDYFIHRTGHGIGLSVHEPPYLAQTYEGLLEVGHCFTIEPGIYLPGKFGIRIENVYAITERGCESLNADPPTQIREID